MLKETEIEETTGFLSFFIIRGISIGGAGTLATLMVLKHIFGDFIIPQ